MKLFITVVLALLVLPFVCPAQTTQPGGYWKAKADAPQSVVDFVASIESRRKAAKTTLPQTIVRYREELGRVQRAIITADEKRAARIRERGEMLVFKTSAERQAKVEWYQRELASLASELAATERPDWLPKIKRAADDREGFASGGFVLVDSIDVIQVAGPSEARVRLQSYPFTEEAWATNLATEGLVDGASVEPRGAVRLSGTKTYNSLGGLRTIRTIEVVDLRSFVEPAE